MKNRKGFRLDGKKAKERLVVVPVNRRRARAMGIVGRIKRLARGVRREREPKL